MRRPHQGCSPTYAIEASVTNPWLPCNCKRVGSIELPSLQGCRHLSVSDNAAWRDDPIGSIAKDRLNRGHIARRVVDLLGNAHSWDSSLVCALTGPWGSGKSSLLGMICEILGERNEWSIARFTPWASSDLDGLLGEFYASLSSALPTDRGKQARNALAVCAQVVAPALKLVPIAGEPLAQNARLVWEALSKPTPWQQAFDGAAAALREAERPVLVIVDDLDRLQRDELLAVLKVVRLLGRFPGVNYLLAYDEQTLFATLHENQADPHSYEPARRFMEKIVQYPITIPPMLPSQIIGQLDEGLTRITSDLNRPLASSEPRLSQLRDVFEHQLTTPRAIGRFLAQVRVALTYHDPREIDDVDLILLAFIRVQFPDLYVALPRWRGPLTRSLSPWEWANGRDKTPDWAELFSRAGDSEDQQDAQDIFEVLFPVTSKHGGLSGPGLSGPGQAGHPDYFSRYFVHTIPENDIADTLIAEALSEAREEGEHQHLMTKLLTSRYPGKTDLALDKLSRASTSTHGEQRTDRQATLPLLSAVMSVLTRLESLPSPLFRHQERAVRWAADLIEQLPPATEPNALATSINCCNDLSPRLQVLRSVRPDRSSCFETVRSVARGQAQDALDAFLENLREKDKADTSPSMLSYLTFIQQYGSMPAAREAIQAELGISYSVEDLAARCANTVHWLMEIPIPKIEDFDQEIFALLAPTEDPFYDESIVSDLDEYDVSWANRRAYAHGRASAPTTAPLAPDC